MKLLLHHDENPQQTESAHMALFQVQVVKIFAQFVFF